MLHKCLYPTTRYSHTDLVHLGAANVFTPLQSGPFAVGCGGLFVPLEEALAPGVAAPVAVLHLHRAQPLGAEARLGRVDQGLRTRHALSLRAGRCGGTKASQDSENYRFAMFFVIQISNWWPAILFCCICLGSPGPTSSWLPSLDFAIGRSAPNSPRVVLLDFRRKTEPDGS